MIFLKLCTARTIAIRSFDGEKGNACNERRRWFVDEEDVRVELGLITLSEASSCAFACLSSETQLSLSISDPLSNDQDGKIK